LELTSGLMVLLKANFSGTGTSATGSLAKGMEKALSTILMEASMKENGKKTSSTAKVSSLSRTEPSTSDLSKTTG